jgi:hypothetical protein
MVWSIVCWAYAAMVRPLIRTTAWVFAILSVVLGPLNVLFAFFGTRKGWLIHIAVNILQFVLGYYLLRYLWRSSRPSRQETAGRDAQQPTP